jgi:hypothetical protein
MEKTRIADPFVAGQFTQKTPGLTSTCQIPCLTPGSTAATAKRRKNRRKSRIHH